MDWVLYNKDSREKQFQQLFHQLDLGLIRKKHLRTAVLEEVSDWCYSLCWGFTFIFFVCKVIISVDFCIEPMLCARTLIAFTDLVKNLDIPRYLVWLCKNRSYAEYKGSRLQRTKKSFQCGLEFSIAILKSKKKCRKHFIGKLPRESFLLPKYVRASTVYKTWYPVQEFYESKSWNLYSPQNHMCIPKNKLSNKSISFAKEDT